MFFNVKIVVIAQGLGSEEMTKTQINALIKSKESILLLAQKEIVTISAKIELIKKELNSLETQLKEKPGDVIITGEIIKIRCDLDSLIKKKKEKDKQIQGLHLEIGKLYLDKNKAIE